MQKIIGQIFNLNTFSRNGAVADSVLDEETHKSKFICYLSLLFQHIQNFAFNWNWLFDLYKFKNETRFDSLAQRQLGLWANNKIKTISEYNQTDSV